MEIVLCIYIYMKIQYMSKWGCFVKQKVTNGKSVRHDTNIDHTHVKAEDISHSMQHLFATHFKYMRLFVGPLIEENGLKN